jgi:hypothetical protein
MVEAFTRSKTKAELLRAALERGLLIAPLRACKNIIPRFVLPGHGAGT